MTRRFTEYKHFDLAKINLDILDRWNKQHTFDKSLAMRQGHPEFVFFEGPPSANGMPGIHHVMARSIKDIFCRYKTMQGFLVERKAGWDTHGLPVELQVEENLKITKVDIGTKISIEEYNNECRKAVMKFTDKWEEITALMGFWLDMKDPYITYDDRYIETLWWLIKELYKKGLLYKGLSIQPYSPAAGTGISSHELNLPGCYKDVKDTTAVAMFKIINNAKSAFLFDNVETDLYFMAWTTTPWTLLSNTALAVGGKITYLKVRTFNPYSGAPCTVILAKDLFGKYFPEANKDLQIEAFVVGDKKIPYKILAEYTGTQLNEIRYEQLLPYQQPETGDAFRVVVGDFVTTEDGTGIVHIAPSFGADDFKVARQNGIGALTLVDKQGKFVDGCGEFTGRYVKKAYDAIAPADQNEVDIDIVTKLKHENKCFKIEKHEHAYPHCWRTDKPILYYPLDAWFIKTTALKERMIELNNTINWKPKSTGTGRFGQWLENLVDWNLSRSRFWGTPLPIWRNADGEEICIGSLEELKAEIEKSVAAGFMQSNPLKDFVVGDNSKENYEKFNMHRPHVDNITLVSATGKPLQREPDLIDVWFDSGAMPYAQWHYPFEHKTDFKELFPADFIAEGVDQTRGWFFTLHAIATMISDSVAFKNIISNGLVLDKGGNKMSKRLKNGVDPFEAIATYGTDPLRWYMITNAPPWDNLKFDTEGVEEVRRKFFGTLYNTYNFFALYANVDGFTYSEKEVPLEKCTEIDRWIISLLNTLVKEVTEDYEDYEPTKAGRRISQFVSEDLSNWYVRLNRKRFWGGEYNENKIAAYQTLYTCLLTVAKLAAPIAPFYMDLLYTDLNAIASKENFDSVHLANFPTYDEKVIDKILEERMNLSQLISSMVLGLRRKVNIKVRQPLQKIIIPILDDTMQAKIDAISNIILTEINVKEIQYLSDATGILVKKIKPNYKTLGPRFGTMMKSIAKVISEMSQQQISTLERNTKLDLTLDGKNVEITLNDVEILSEDIPGWLVSTEGRVTVALDITVTKELKEEGIARELINRIQNIRKESGFEVTDRIMIEMEKHADMLDAITNFGEYISTQTLAGEILLSDKIEMSDTVKEIIIDENIKTFIKINKR